MPDASSSDLNDREFALRKEELAIQRARLAVDFAKYGFGGTLTAAIAGMLMLVVLALLESFSQRFTLGVSGYLALGFMILGGCIAFGYLSLWTLPSVTLKLMSMQMVINQSGEAVTVDANRKAGKGASPVRPPD